MNKLQKFENFLKEVQQSYNDEFTDLLEINTRYTRLAKTNMLLHDNHEKSGGEMDNLISKMDGFKKEAGQKTLNFTNQIADEQRQLQSIEAEKALLMIGNEEKTEQMLKTTSEHGIILMSIKSLWQKIALKNEQNDNEVHFIWHKNVPRGEEVNSGGSQPAFSQEDCL